MFYAGSAGLGALIVVCIYIAGFSLSWGPVVWVMLAEIFPNSIRDKAMAIAVAAQWFMNWVVTVTFNIMDGTFGAHGGVQPRLRLLAVRRLQRAGRPVRLEVRPGEQRACRSRTCRSSGSRRPSCDPMNPAACLTRDFREI